MSWVLSTVFLQHNRKLPNKSWPSLRNQIKIIRPDVRDSHIRESDLTDRTSVFRGGLPTLSQCRQPSLLSTVGCLMLLFSCELMRHRSHISPAGPRDYVAENGFALLILPLHSLSTGITGMYPPCLVMHCCD